MGFTYVNGVVSGRGGKRRPVRFLVDSGARYTLLPHGVWTELGLTPKRSQEFVLADGTTVTRNISECRIQLPQGDTATPVILGEPRDKALLGVVTLEELGLVLHPFTRELHHEIGLLA